MPLDADRVVCSTITLRHLPLDHALETIAGLGFRAVDLGALPGVCDHVPYGLDPSAVADVAATVRASGLVVRSVNADVGDLNAPLDEGGQDERDQHLDRLLELCVAIGADAVVLPNGRQDHQPFTTFEQDLDRSADQLARAASRAGAVGVELWVEAPHLFRLVHDLDGAVALFERLPAGVGAVLDVSHVVAAGSTPRAFVDAIGQRVRHVHLRDASPGYIHHSIGRGRVDFADAVAALAEHGYHGALALELETRDVTDAERPAVALAAGEEISDLLVGAGAPVRGRA